MQILKKSDKCLVIINKSDYYLSTNEFCELLSSLVVEGWMLIDVSTNDDFIMKFIKIKGGKNENLFG